MGYYILHRPGLRSDLSSGAPDKTATQWRAELERGSLSERRAAVRELVALNAEGTLALCLASEEPEVAQLAAAGLWECWMNEAGNGARQEMERGVEAMNAGDLETAASTFTHLMDKYPRWTEAVNKQATVFYLQGHLPESIELCQKVVKAKPDHFGAWNGMAICAIQTENWSLAFHAVQESLRLQPSSKPNLQLLRLIESRLPQV